MTARRTAGLFDLRVIIALLMGIFGLVVTLMGLFGSSTKTTASGDPLEVNVNLWSGIPMLLLAAGFALWAKLRPTVLPPEPADDEEPPD
ncbi:MAG: hypothetical protein GEV07_27540 [Streptosporangiales bacterium]|nr:hypothetical protein [Streptosporangiales bacterium]